MPRGKAANGGPDPIDVEVGRRVRNLRIERGMNQSELGRALGLTFQQVQKYEKATNRISASKMVGIARALRVAPAYFLNGLGDDDAAPVEDAPLIPKRLRTALLRIPARHLTTLADVAEAMTPA